MPPPGFQEFDVGSSIGSPKRVAPDGTFTLRHLPAGRYTLLATTSFFTTSNALPPYSVRRSI